MDPTKSEQAMPLRQGGKVITEEGYFAKIVGLSGGAGEDPPLLELEVTGIGLCAGVPASQVTALGTVTTVGQGAEGPRAVAAVRAAPRPHRRPGSRSQGTRRRGGQVYDRDAGRFCRGAGLQNETGPAD